MFRRHLSNIVYLSLVILVGGLYGVLLGALSLTLWPALGLSLLFGVVVALLGDVIAKALVRWYDERQAIKRYEQQNPRP